MSSDIVPAGAISETPSGFTSSTEEVFYEEEDLHADTETELKKRLEAKEADEDAELEKEIAQMKAAVQKARAAGSSEAEPTLEPEIEATLPPAPEPITTSFEPEKVFAEPELELYNVVRENIPTYIFGGRGSGKTMILRSLNPEVIVKRNNSLRLYADTQLVKSYKAAFGRNKSKFKTSVDDYITPEGTYKIC